MIKKLLLTLYFCLLTSSAFGALTEGTNCGFCLVSPSVDPAGSNAAFDTAAGVSKYTSPADATKIVEIGWWCDNATEEAGFDLALYAADGGVVPGEAGTRLYVAADNAKGTTAGFKKVTVDWAISGSTAYWLGFQLDDTATATYTNYADVSFYGYDYRTAQTSLPNPFGGGAIYDADRTLAVYVVYETTPVTRRIIMIQ